jgi:DNA-binding LacI/PurR family transcriptional regulator
LKESTLKRREVYGLLRASIVDGALPPGSAFATERELAHIYGLTRAMARTITKQLEKDGLIERTASGRPILSTPTHIKRAPSARPGSLNISVWPGAPGGGLANILIGIQRAAGDLGVSVSLGPWATGTWSERVKAERDFLEWAAGDDSISGVLLWYIGLGVNDAVLEKLSKAGKSLVFIDRNPPEGIIGDTVATDSFAGARAGVMRLIKAGHRRIGLLSNSDRISSVAERINGYRTALKRAQIPHDPSLEVEIISSSSLPIDEAVKKGVAKLAKGPTPVSAIFAINDFIAMFALKALEDLGIRVPEDMAVIGFDGVARWDRSLPDVAGAEQQFDAMGERAVEILWGRATGSITGQPLRVLLEAPFRSGATFREAKFTPPQE